MTGDKDIPLVVDLDGSLLKTDLLFESFWNGLSRHPAGTIRSALRHLGHKPSLKVALTGGGRVDISLLPVNAEVLSLCRDAAEAGRAVYIATGAAGSGANAVADYHGGFAGVFATDGETNLTGARKAARLEAEFGAGGFDYVGDTATDIPIWRIARKCFVARPASGLSETLAAKGIDAEPLGYRWRMRDLARGLRAHQWVKNVLLFLPLITAHAFTAQNILAVILGIICFSAAASAIYVVNDLLDLDADRRHPSKHRRVFASGAVPIRIGMAASALLGIFALVLAAAISLDMLSVIVSYIAITLAYSLSLKRRRWIDIATLAALYTMRVLAGAVVTGLAVSGWLIAFVFPAFLTLACVKRMTELSRAQSYARIPGRAYAKADREDLLNVSLIAGVASVAVFVGYAASSAAAALYANPWQLNLVALPLSGWFYHMIRTGWTGKQVYDPIAFALRDRVSLVMLLLTLLCIAFATGF